MSFLEILFLLGAGSLGGFLAGMLGVGGGIIFLPVLDYVIGPYINSNTELVKYTLANSLVLVAISGVAGSIKQKSIGNYYFKPVIITSIAALATSLLFSYFIKSGNWYKQEYFLMLFLVLIIAAFFQMKKNSKLLSSEESEISSKSIHFVFIGAFTGILIAFSGLGGGIIMVPLFNGVLKLNIKKATSISLGVIPFAILPSLILYASSPNAVTLPFPAQSGYINLGILLPLALGVITFTSIGIKAAHRLKSRTINLIFATLLFLILIKTIYQLLKMKNLLPVLFFLVSTVSFAQSKKDQSAIKRMKQTITYLASDKLEGRLTGSPGEMESAKYIAERFASLKLKPLGNNGTYYQEFDIVKLRITGDKCLLMNNILPIKLQTHVDFYPISQSSNDAFVKAKAQYVGFGIEADSFGLNDYAEQNDLKGKIFIIKLGGPESNDPHSKFAPVTEVSQKINTAIKYGAAGIVFINPDSFEVPTGKMKRTMFTEKIPIFMALTNAQMWLRADSITMKSDIRVVLAKGHNVIAFKNNKSKNTVIIGAHHDHLGYGELGGSRTKENGLIHNGADDNASGVAAMLELAQKISKNKKLKKNNYLFMAFSGEELGLIGSQYFTENPTIKLADANYMLNIDMLGRLDSNLKTLVINGVGTSPNWTEDIIKIKIDTNKIKITTTESGIGSSDHTSFYINKIPVLHFFTGQHADYHMPSDDEEKINYTGMIASTNIIYDFVKLSNKKGKLNFVKTKDVQLRGSYKVTMGIMPDYTFAGKGVKVSDVTEGKTAFKCGVIKGDVISQMGPWNISDMSEYVQALQKFNKGDKTTVIVIRNNEKITLNVQF